MSEIITQIRLILEKRRLGTISWLDWVVLAQLVTAFIASQSTPVIGAGPATQDEVLAACDNPDCDCTGLLSAIAELCEDCEVDGPEAVGLSPRIAMLLKKLLELIVEQLLK